jgi:hypothetical protein
MPYEGTQWKVANGGTFKYIPLRHRNDLISPSVTELKGRVN